MTNRIIFFVIISFITFITCSDYNRKAELSIIGDNSWFTGSSNDSTYILNNLHYNFKNKIIDWPPKELSRIIDISFDITGSTYNKHVEHNNGIITLSEYLLSMLKKFLLFDVQIRNGDIIHLRMMGENKGGYRISPRENDIINIAPYKLTLKANVLTRKHDDLQLHVISINKPQINNNAKVDEICNWFQPFINKSKSINEQYMYSPIFQHFERTINSHIHNIFCEKIFIYVTDGWAEMEDLKFWPSYFHNDNTLYDKLVCKLDNLNLRPFQNNSPPLNCKVYIIGLNDGNSPSYKEAQQKIYNWFFEPNKCYMLYY